jgi:hypothetical protein
MTDDQKRKRAEEILDRISDRDWVLRTEGATKSTIEAMLAFADEHAATVRAEAMWEAMREAAGICQLVAQKWRAAYKEGSELQAYEDEACEQCAQAIKAAGATNAPAAPNPQPSTAVVITAPSHEDVGQGGAADSSGFRMHDPEGQKYAGEHHD